jgi:hypothetical protein
LLLPAKPPLKELRHAKVQQAQPADALLLELVPPLQARLLLARRQKLNPCQKLNLRQRQNLYRNLYKSSAQL